MKKNSTLFALLASFLLLSTGASAIELSLEENRAERGSIGYIDMQRLFKTFPETVRSKENFEEVVRQAEEQLNLRKAEILRLRNELSQLKIEREFIARNPVVDIAAAPAAPPPPPRVPEAPKPQPVAPEAPKPPPTIPLIISTPAASAPTQYPSAAVLPGMVSTETMKAPAYQKPEPLTINIPGVSTAPIVVQPPQTPAAPAPSIAPTVSTSAFIAPPQVAVATTAAPTPSAITPPLNAALVEIDGKIAVKARELAQKESDFKDQQSSAEKNLLDLESRKTEILLGKIYKAVQQVARKEGISVIVDKGSILYGHDAVDLTEKTLNFLKGEQ